VFRFFPTFLAAVAATAQTSSPLQYTVFLGDQAQITSVAVDNSGSAYITGSTSAPLPVTAGAVDTSYTTPNCALPPTPSYPHSCQIVFAGKLNAEGTAFSYLTYLPVSASNNPRIAVDAQGDAWITGSTSWNSLPVTPGAVESQVQGNGSGFVIKLNPSASAILFATYLGGTAGIAALALDSTGGAYITGFASSGIPFTPGSFRRVRFALACRTDLLTIVRQKPSR